MIYRSYNSELLIATGLLSHVFNDIVLDRRKHGMNEKFDKPISAKDMVQKTIEVPCVYGQRSIILRSLENETGTYKLPLIILSGKSLKSDPVRNADIHVDVFYQQDEQFSKIYDEHHPKYRTYELSKRRGIPVTLQFDLTFVSKYKEDIDQMITNWIVHFRPDIYVKWWHPRQKSAPLTSEILWDQNIGFESPIEFDIKSVYTHKATTTFTFKTWIFPGMNTEEDAIDPETEAIIKKFKFYPYRSSDWDENALVSGERDANEETGFPVWGNLKDENIGDMGMWAVPNDSKFYIESSTDLSTEITKDLKDGKYFVNNVFADSDPILSGSELTDFKHNNLAGDFWSSLLQYDYPSWSSYQNYLIVNPQRGDNLQFSAVYFKGAMPQSAFIESPPSGDYLFKHFFNPYRANILDETAPLYDLEFGSSLKMRSSLEYAYDIDNKTLALSSIIKNDEFKFYCKSIIKSNTEIAQEIVLEAVPLYSLDIKLQFNRSIDDKFNLNDHSQILTNVKLYNDIGKFGGVQFAFEEPNFKRNANNMIHIIKTYWNAMTLRNTDDNYFELVFESMNYGEEVQKYGLDDTGFTKLRKIKEDIKDGYLYEVLANNYLYFILKTSLSNEEESDIYDWWVLSLPKFKTYYAPIFVVEPEYARLVYGLNYQMSI